MAHVFMVFQDAEGRPIAGPRLKLIRAHEHLTSLHNLIADWRKLNRNPAALDPNPEAGEQVYRRGPVTPLPATVVMALGDTLQCLRSALDHAIYSIVLPDPAHESLTEFPVFMYDDRTSEDGGRIPGFTTRTRRLMPLLPTPIQEFITAQQPYNREKGLPPDGHPLWGLHTLCNLDKHRTLPILISVTRPAGLEYVTPTTPDPAPPPNVRWHGPAMQEGDPIVSVPIPDKTYVAFQPRVEVDVVLHTPGFPNIEILKAGVRLYDYVAWAIGEMEPFFSVPASEAGTHSAPPS
jgi:hypothetical protein